jgi:DNA-binding MarR family transcriptional regulator
MPASFAHSARAHTAGISPRDLDVILANQGDPETGLHGIAEATGMTKSNIRTALFRMVDAGMGKRVMDNSGRFITSFALSPKGRAA